MSRSRDGECVCSEVNNFRAASETSATARLNAASLACDGLLKPESLRTNCSAEAWISSSLAGGSKLNSVLMLRHIIVLPCPPRCWFRSGSRRTIGRSKILLLVPFCHRIGDAFTPCRRAPHQKEASSPHGPHH